MLTARISHTDNSLKELLGTFLQVSARSTAETHSLRHVADRFSDWALRQPVVRLDRVYDHLVSGQLDPRLEELGLG